MGKFNYSLVLASVIVASPLAAANAADLTPEPMVVPAPIPAAACCDSGGFYLKGYVGMTNQEADGFTNDIIESANFQVLDHGFDSSPLVGIGLGYQFDRHIRFDVTGEYRGDSNFRGLDYAVDFGYNNEHTGIKSEWLALANVYWDIATFRGITPFVGAGVGTAAVSLKNFYDVNQNNNALFFAEDNTEWNFAWALHAGLAYEVTDSLTVDVAYRYVNMGDGVTDQYQAYNNPGFAALGPTTIEDIESHDVMVGLRWKWDDGGCCAAPAYVETSYPTTYK
jgi:opacity protein-like surface antigen